MSPSLPFRTSAASAATRAAVHSQRGRCRALLPHIVTIACRERERDQREREDGGREER
jgi:hypothetical protein